MCVCARAGGARAERTYVLRNDFGFGNQVTLGANGLVLRLIKLINTKEKGLLIYYGEWGCITTQTKATGRYEWYKQHAVSIRSHGFAASVWDGELLDGFFYFF